MAKNISKWSPNGSQHRPKIDKKTRSDKLCEKGMIPCTRREKAYGPNLISTRFLRKNNKKENNLQKTYLKTNQTNCAGKLSEKNDRRNAKRRNAKVEYMVECNQGKEPLDTLKHARWPTATCGSRCLRQVPHRAWGVGCCMAG